MHSFSFSFSTQSMGAPKAGRSTTSSGERPSNSSSGRPSKPLERNSIPISRSRSFMETLWIMSPVMKMRLSGNFSRVWKA